MCNEIFYSAKRFHDNILTKVKPVMVTLIYNANASVDTRDNSMINNRTALSLLLYFSGFFLEAEGLFPPVTILLDLFPCAGYFFNAFD